jgi:hypothetical protein
MYHIINNSSNLHLQNALLKYGLSHFAFVILEYCIPSDLLPPSSFMVYSVEARDEQSEREQHFLDILFSLAKNLRYNFSPTAGSPLGVVRSEETRGDPPSGGGTPLIPPSQGRRGGRGCYNNGGGGLSMISYYQDVRSSQRITIWRE